MSINDGVKKGAKQCGNCWRFTAYTAVHDDARGGWVHLGLCALNETPALVPADMGCPKFERWDNWPNPRTESKREGVEL